MSTKANFYAGHGPDARWLGSLQYDANPGGVASVPPGRLALSATDSATFAEAVKDVLVVGEETGVGYAFHPDDGWRWPWPDSTMID